MPPAVHTVSLTHVSHTCQSPYLSVWAQTLPSFTVDLHCPDPNEQQNWRKKKKSLEEIVQSYQQQPGEFDIPASLSCSLLCLPYSLTSQRGRIRRTQQGGRESEYQEREGGRERGTVPMKGSQNGGRTGQGKPGVGLGNDNALWDRGWAQINSVRHRPCVQQDTTQPSTWWGKKQETKKRLSGYDLRANRHNTGRRGEGGPWVYVLSFCSCQNGIQQNTWEWAETRTTTNMHICIYVIHP